MVPIIQNTPIVDLNWKLGRFFAAVRAALWGFCCILTMPRRSFFSTLEEKMRKKVSGRSALSARVLQREFLRLFASESAANTPHTHYNTLMPPHRPVVLTGSSLVAFAKSPAARELSGRPEWAQDTTKTEVSGRNGTSTQLRGTWVGRGAPSWLVLVCGS